MPNIRIFMKDETKLDFFHEGRAGGSYTKTIRYEGGFAIVTDEWDKETAIPTSDIKLIETRPHR